MGYRGEMILQQDIHFTTQKTDEMRMDFISKRGRRYIASLIIALMVGFNVYFIFAIILAISNIYLLGRNSSLLQDQIFDGPILYGSMGDLILIVAVSFCVPVAFLISYILLKPKS